MREFSTIRILRVGAVSFTAAALLSACSGASDGFPPPSVAGGPSGPTTQSGATTQSAVTMSNTPQQGVAVGSPSLASTSAASARGAITGDNDRASHTPLLYVPNAFNNTLTTYTLDGTQSTVTITKGLSDPVGVSVDAAGNIHVVNLGNTGFVATYTSNGTRTTPTITKGLAFPDGVADGASKIYVSNEENPSIDGTVTTYTSDGVKTTPTITTLKIPSDVAVDSRGKIYVSNAPSSKGGTVTTYAADGKQTTPTITAGLSSPQAVAVDASG